MYTFQALATIDTVNNHEGFYIVATLCVIACIISLLASDEIEEFRALAMFAAVVVAIAAGISYNTGSITTFANTKVSATLVGFQAEGFNIEERNGKQTRRVDKHELYVVYATPNGNAIFTAQQGVTYPKTAILYKN